MSGQEPGIWDDVLQAVSQRLPEVEFRTWFGQVRPLGIENGVFLVGTPSTFVRDWLRSNYSEVIELALKELGAATPKVGFQVAEGFAPPEQQAIFGVGEEPDGHVAAPGSNGSADARRRAPRPSSRGTRDQSAAPLAAGRRVAPLAGHGPAENSILPRLNPKYVFTNFVVGGSNNMAHAAAQAVVESPGKAYNPLFLYGESGLGKTHLMHAVGHAVAQRHPQLIIEYVTTEAFVNELVDAIRGGGDKMAQFRDRYRGVDLLLVDDVQFIAGKQHMQEEFFHTFNALYESGKQLILSSDRPPNDIPTLEKRLRSRFLWGFTTEILAPELETRMAILGMNAEYRGVKVPADVIDYIARHVTSNIRELEGALVRTIVYASMNQLPLNRQTVAKALSDVFAPSELNLTMADILRVTAKQFNVSGEDVRGKGRRQELVLPRQVAMYLIRELTSHSFSEIGNFFSGRDHSTVMYAVNRVAEALEADSSLGKAARAVRAELI